MHIRFHVFSAALCGVLLLAGAARAQEQPAAQPQFAIATAAVDSVPQTTVVAVQQPPVQLVARTTVYEEPTRGMDRAERRAYRATVYAARIDSLVQSRNYVFFPNSMQEIPGGMIRSIYADFYFFGLFVDHVEVHLPAEQGVTQYVEMLNFDSMSLRDYRAARLQWGWMISFDIVAGSDCYHAGFEISTATGETILTLAAPRMTMRYVGWLWHERPHDARRHRPR